MQGFEPMHIVGAFLDETSWTAFQHSTIIFFYAGLPRVDLFILHFKIQIIISI